MKMEEEGLEKRSSRGSCQGGSLVEHGLPEGSVGSKQGAGVSGASEGVKV